jgi:hypothetical protein
VASKIALDMLHWAMRLASHQRIVMAIGIVIDLPAFFVFLDSMFAHNVS